MNRAHMNMKYLPMENLPAINFPIIIRRRQQEWITLPDHQALSGSKPANPANASDSAASNISFFKIDHSRRRNYGRMDAETDSL